MCPGCKCTHSIDSRWTFNGDMEKPTIRASILVHMDKPPHPEVKICHSYVTNGNIEFLSDCTHELVGQTVPLNDI